VYGYASNDGVGESYPIHTVYGAASVNFFTGASVKLDESKSINPALFLLSIMLGLLGARAAFRLTYWLLKRRQRRLLKSGSGQSAYMAQASEARLSLGDAVEMSAVSPSGAPPKDAAAGDASDAYAARRRGLKVPVGSTMFVADQPRRAAGAGSGEEGEWTGEDQQPGTAHAAGMICHHSSVHGCAAVMESLVGVER